MSHDPPPQPSPTGGEGVISCRRNRCRTHHLTPSPPVGEGWGGGYRRSLTRAAGAWIVVLLVIASTAAQAANVKVTVEGVPNNRGEVHVDLCTEKTFLTPDCPFDVAAPAHRGRITLTLTHIPPGRYAAVGYHDENANRDLDVNALGIPKERYGFSNDPPMLMGPPLFKDSAFDVAEKDVQVKIRLKR
jgi:uncharacterized protein (DUF2141 family)